MWPEIVSAAQSHRRNAQNWTETVLVHCTIEIGTVGHTVTVWRAMAWLLKDDPPSLVPPNLQLAPSPRPGQ